MTKTVFKIEFVNDAFPGMAFSAQLAADVPQSAKFADVASFQELVGDIGSKRSFIDTAFMDIATLRPGFDPDAVHVSSISVAADPFDLKKYAVEMPDGTSERAFAQSYAAASMLAALRFRFQGKKFLELLGPTDELLSDLLAVKFPANENAKSGEWSGVRCEFEVADWRIRELCADELNDEQKAPMTFSVVDYGYGPAALFKRGDDEYAVMMEIDRGCVVARAAPLHDETILACVRMGRAAMQVEMANGSDHVAFNLDQSGTGRSASGEVLTQDGAKEPSPAA